MGWRTFVKHVTRVTKRAVTRPVATVRRVVRNPSKHLVPAPIRRQKWYRPVAKTTASIAAGVAGAALVGATGGLALAAAGAVGAGVGIKNGALTQQPFNPRKHILYPAAGGALSGAVSVYGAGTVSAGIKGAAGAVSTALGLGGAVAQSDQPQTQQTQAQQQAQQKGADTANTRLIAGGLLMMIMEAL